MLQRKSVLLSLLAAAVPVLSCKPAFAQSPPSIHWQSEAQFHQLLKKETRGALLIDNNGISFQSPKFSKRWPYGEIQTFELSGARELTITGYENRARPQPGERRFRFTLNRPIPPDLAARIAAWVGRPVINGDPPSDTPIIAEIPAHRRERIGGSNGTLRLREDGIDYVSADGRDGRSWRWSDIQTLANPNPWEFRVTAYREIVEFDLKRPLSRDVFNRLWDILYAQDLNIAPGKDGRHQRLSCETSR